MKCPACKGIIVMAEQISGRPVQPPNEGPGVCAGCATFLWFNLQTDTVIEMTVDQIAELTDIQRNAMLRQRMEIDDRRAKKREEIVGPNTLLDAVCQQCGEIKLRVRYVAKYIGRDKQPPCPKCGGVTWPAQGEAQRFTDAVNQIAEQIDRGKRRK